MTFSITARCDRTGRLGVAISTAVPAVGSRCAYARSEVGAIATQAITNPYLGIRGLDLLGDGLDPPDVVRRLLKADEGREHRQLALVGHREGVAGHTGAEIKEWCGHLEGTHCVVAGNLLVGPETIEAMLAEFQNHSDDPLAERLTKSLESGQRAGGDRRGRVSAALLVVNTEEYPETDLRVDEHVDPVAELRRLLTLMEERKPYELMRPTKTNPAGVFDPEQREALVEAWHRDRKRSDQE